MENKPRLNPLCAALFIALGGSSSSAISASTDITDNPLPVTSSVAPNIMFMIDNSGSMSTTVPGSGGLSRLDVAKSSAISILNSLGKVRVGLFSYYYNYNDDGGKLNEIIGDLDSTKLSTMTSKINALTASTWTPIAETLSDIGRYFTTGYPSSSNLTLHPGTANQSTATVANIFNRTYQNATGLSTIPNPIQYYCQKSFVVMMTDGLPTHDADVSDYLKEYYGYCTNSANAANCTGTYGRRYYQLTGITSGSPSTTPEAYETSDKGTDYLDDVAAALYDIDLRPDLTPATGTKTAKNNLTTYTIGFADPVLETTTLLERAAKYGGGLYMTASDSASLVNAFQKATDDILAKDGSAAAVAVANAHVTNLDNGSYATSYNSGTWTGDLIAYPINTSTGLPDVMNPIWNTGCSAPNTYVDPNDPSKGYIGCSAQVQLDAKTSSSRYIFTNNDTATCYSNCGIPFQPTSASGTSGTDKISAAQKSRLNTPSASDGDNVLDYLRGTKTYDTAGTYRSRTHLLGDTVNAEPLVIRTPFHYYADAGYLTCTTTGCTPFRLANENRTKIVIQAANDGMVHAFNRDTGVEEWAYVPNALISEMNDPANSSTSLLNTRSRKSFNHYFMIDATPVSGDVDFDKANNASGTSSPDWRTIVVGGYGKGGRGYYALDVTSTTATSESNAATKALWEFPRSIQNSTARTNAFKNIGYTFGKPIIVKTAAAGWVILVTSGYNNGTNTGDTQGDGLGHLYVINPKTGDLIKDIPTSNCNSSPTTSPCGLTHINAYVEDREVNNTATYVYGGDLYGNVWRFDLTGSTTTSWNVTKLATLRSGSTSSDTPQPITSVPELAKVVSGTTSLYFVYIGTGQYLGKSDLPCPPSPATCAWTPNTQSTQTQTIYGLVDPRDGSTLPDPLRTNLLQRTYTTSGSTRLIADLTGSNANKTTAQLFSGSGSYKGWYIDFTNGERIVTDPALAAGGLVFTSNIPSTVPCVPGGSSWIYAIDYEKGGTVNTTWSGTLLANALASRPVLVQLPSGKIVAITRQSDATTLAKEVPVSATANVGKRVSWRELLDN